MNAAKFHISINGRRTWAGSSFDDAATAINAALAEPDTRTADLSSGSNIWAWWTRRPDGSWRGRPAARGQENLPVYNLPHIVQAADFGAAIHDRNMIEGRLHPNFRVSK